MTDVRVSEQDVDKAVRGFLAAFHPDGKRGMAKLDTAHNLWREVSSLSMLELVSYVETKFGVTVRPIDFAPQNFSSISAIARFVVTRKNG